MVAAGRKRKREGKYPKSTIVCGRHQKVTTVAGISLLLRAVAPLAGQRRAAAILNPDAREASRRRGPRR
jgi:hypothetical protein